MHVYASVCVYISVYWSVLYTIESNTYACVCVVCSMRWREERERGEVI